MMDKESWAQSSLFHEEHGTKRLKEKRSVGGQKAKILNW